MKYEEALATTGSKQRPGIPLKDPTSITIHWIGPYPAQSILDVVKWWETGPDNTGIEASAHYIIKDENVRLYIPINEVAWHCGSKGNYTSIGIEVIPMNKGGEFSDLSIQSLHDLLKTLPQVELKRHFDWTKKDCPRFYTPLVPMGDDAWIDLKLRLQS